jgi:D-glycero-alpha-D-manno-heptose-7-phosphate kinase
MLITQTPFRVSFLAEGLITQNISNARRAVLGTAIDKYAYFSMTKFFYGLFDYNIRIAYSKIECVNEIEEIQHTPFKECLKFPAYQKMWRLITPRKCLPSPGLAVLQLLSWGC